MPRSTLLRLCLLVLSLQLVACSGTRLYERANDAAAASDYPRAVAYDARAASDLGAQPPTFAAQFASHTTKYADEVLARLGPPSLANADAQATALRGLLSWARAQNQASSLSAVRIRLGELTRVRWVTVQALADGGRTDEAVVLGRALLVDADGADGERAALDRLAEKARAAHEAEVARLAAAPSHEGAVVLRERLARQMGGMPTPVGTQAEAVVRRKTGMAATVTATNAGECDAAVTASKALLPNDGDTPVRFAFRFASCSARNKADTVESWRTVAVEDEVNETVSDLVPRMECQSVRTGSATICNNHDFDGRLTCHEEETSGQKCDTRYTAVEHTERVRRTRNIQQRYNINHLTVDIDYQVTLSTDIDGQHFEVDSRGTATSGVLTTEDAAPSPTDAAARATNDLARRLDGATRALARFARKTQTDTLRAEAQAALAAGDAGRAESIYVEISFIEGAPAAELKPAGVTEPQLAAAIAGRPFERADGAAAAPSFPSVPEEEILEDAHERTNAMTLSAEARAGSMGGLIGGVSRYTASTPGDSSTGGFVGALATGAEQVGTRFTGAGGSFHLFGNFDGGTSSFDASFDLGFGLKLGQFYLMPVAGGAVGTSTHASPSDSNFRPNAALRATALDAVYGGQVTFALPYPVNVTVNAQLVRTAPIPLDDFKQWTTRLYGTLGYHFSSAIDLLVFGRYWELDTESVKPLEFFGGNGHDHRLLTVGLGIGGTSEKFISKLFGGTDSHTP